MKAQRIKELEQENAELKNKVLELQDFNHVTDIEGDDDFPSNVNEYLESVEKIAIQESEGLKSSNVLVDGMKHYDVNDGSVIEKSVIKMAESYAFDRDAWDKTPIDPTAVVKYWNNWEKRQYGVTVRRDDIRKIVANKGVSVDDFVTEILDTLTQGEGKEDYALQIRLLFNADFKDYSSVLGGYPKSIKGVTYALRNMYNHMKATNNDMTVHNYASATPAENIRIGVSSDLLNLIDVTELANVFNLSKEELFGKLVIFDLSILKEYGYTDEQIRALQYRAFVYDVNALIKGVRLREITTDMSGKGRFTNYYLTVDRLFAHCGLFKGAYINCIDACLTARADIIGEPSTVTVTDTLSHASTENPITSLVKYEPYRKHYVCDDGYNLLGESAVASVSMGNQVLENAITIADDGKSADVNVDLVSDNLVITLTAVAD